jgi:autotransporter-associated beta strand protein
MTRYCQNLLAAAALLLLISTLGLRAQTLTLTNGIHTYPGLTNTTVTMTGQTELWVTAAANPLPGCLVHLNSPDAFVFLPNILPSVVVSSHLSQFRVNGAIAVADNNCRVVQHNSGAVIIPHAASFQPLQVFSGPHFTGSAMSLNQWTYYRSPQLGTMNAQISSFKLKRGYAVTIAQNENGTGISRNYVAQDNDLEVSLLPGNLDNRARFVYVTPWRWVSKKGSCDASPTDLQASWWYNWNLNQNSTRDLEYVAIKQQPHWPGLNQNWQARGVNHLLGFNEPNNPVEDAYKNLTPPGSVSDAVARWPELLGTGLRVGAPAVTDGGSGWITDFMNQAEAAGMRVDYVPIHYYRCFGDNNNPAGAATQLYNFLKGIYDMAKRPLWVTEFNNGANWTSCAVPTYAQNASVVQAMIQMMDNTPWIERYSIYSKVEFTRQTHYDGGGLTPMGEMYRAHQAPLAYLQGLPDNGTRSFSQLQFDGDSRDSSGHGNNGIVTSSPTYTNSPRGQALVFDGTNTKVTLPPNIAKTNAFTFAAWVHWNGGDNWQRIFDFGNSVTHYMFLTPSSGSGTLRFGIRNGGTEQIVQTVGALAQNSWQHVAVTLGGGVARIYVNGTQAAIASINLTPANFSPRVNFLGDSQFGADPLFRGMMDEVLITDYVLSAAQIAALQTNTPPQFTNTFISGGTANPDEPYNFSIAGMATDPDVGQTLTYGKASGPAWLNVAANGTITGTPGEMNGGTNHFTVIATDSAGQSGFATLAVSIPVVVGNGVWIANADGNWSEPARWSGGVVANGQSFQADFSTINITANRTVTLDSPRSIGSLRFGDTSGSQTWTVAAIEDGRLKLDSGSATLPTIHVATPTTLAVPLEGTNGFAKTGTSTLMLSGNNALTGTVNIDTASTSAADGVVRAAHPSALADVSLIRIRNNNNGSSTLQLDGSLGEMVLPAQIDINCRNNTVPTIQNLSGTNTLSGFLRVDVGGNMFNLVSDNGLLVLSGSSQYLGTLTGGRTYAFSGVGHHLVTGPILNSINGAPISLSKSGSGTLTLAGANTYASTTTVSGGTLLVNGATAAASAVTVSGGATLGGTGVINGAVTLQFNATLAPGASIGKLTVNNAMTLQAGSITRLEISAAPKTNDVLQVNGLFTRGGSLVVTNVAGDLAPGDAFSLFQTPNVSGSFTSVSLPPLNFGLAWDTSSLNAGVISVVATNPPALTNWSWHPDGSFALGGLGAASQPYTLQAATNLDCAGDLGAGHQQRGRNRRHVSTCTTRKRPRIRNASTAWSRPDSPAVSSRPRE